MRERFATELYELMKKDKNIILITADLGYGIFDKIRSDMSDRFYNVGAAEQVMMDMAIGFSLNKKIPVVYSITPFLIFRAFESIRNYIYHEKIKVVMVGSGRGQDYRTEGFSHDANDHKILRQFSNIKFIVPEDNDFDLNSVIYMDKPVYLNLRK
jgi:transketolase